MYSWKEEENESISSRLSVLNDNYPIFKITKDNKEGFSRASSSMGEINVWILNIFDNSNLDEYKERN